MNPMSSGGASREVEQRRQAPPGGGPIATAWRLYDGGVVGGRSLIAYGSERVELKVLEPVKWNEIRKRIEEMS